MFNNFFLKLSALIAGAMLVASSWLASAHANVDETHAGKRNHALHSVIPW